MAKAGGGSVRRQVTRRDALRIIGGAAGAVGAGPVLAQGPLAPPSTITTPPRDFRPGALPSLYFNDPDVVSVDPQFDAYVQPNAPIQRLWTGGLWLEGPAWNGVGRFLVFSDIPNNRQMRWLEDDGSVTPYRIPANNS